MFARMLRWVMTTPFGSAVAPDVKMISAVSSAVSVVFAAVAGLAAGWRSSLSDHTGVGPGIDSAATASPTRMARAVTMAATFSRKAADVR